MQVWASDGDGQNLAQLTSAAEGSGTPRWSPDGRLIAFDRHLQDGWRILLFYRFGDGKALEIAHIDHEVAGFGGLSLSPNGKSALATVATRRLFAFTRSESRLLPDCCRMAPYAEISRQTTSLISIRVSRHSLTDIIESEMKCESA